MKILLLSIFTAFAAFSNAPDGEGHRFSQDPNTPTNDLLREIDRRILLEDIGRENLAKDHRDQMGLGEVSPFEESAKVVVACSFLIYFLRNQLLPL